MPADMMYIQLACLGAAKILNELKNEWEGTIKLIFQPGEEKNPGGASLYDQRRCVGKPKTFRHFRMHVHPGMPVGKTKFQKWQSNGQCR